MRAFRYVQLIERPQEEVQHPERGVQDGELPDQGGRGRHDQERADDERPQEPAAEHVPVQQQGDAQPEQHRQDDRDGGEQHGVHHGGPEDRVVEDDPVVVEGGEVPGGGRVVQVVFLEAVPQGQQERDLGDHDHEDERRNQRRPPDP